MALFKRMREMARKCAEEGHVTVPPDDDVEGTIALQHLDNIWGELRDVMNRHRKQVFLPPFPADYVIGKDYYHQTLKRIDEDQQLVFDGWKLGHGEVSFYKRFLNPDQRSRAAELLAMVDFADGNVTEKFRYPDSEMIDEGIPTLSGNIDRQLSKEKHAKTLVVRRDWLEAFARNEEIPIGIRR